MTVFLLKTLSCRIYFKKCTVVKPKGKLANILKKFKKVRKWMLKFYDSIWISLFGLFPTTILHTSLLLWNTRYITENLFLGTPAVGLRKTNSVAQMFEREKIRRGSDHAVKRAESMKVGPGAKPVKRTPSFTTRRKGSFKSKNPCKKPAVSQSVQISWTNVF